MKKLVVSGKGRETDPLWAAAGQSPDPRRLDIYYESGIAPEGFSEPGAYLCEGGTCELPVNDPVTMKSRLTPVESG